MSQTLDPTFYRTPADAIAAPPERLAYVAAYDPAGRAKDAMAVLDCDPASPSYGQVVGEAGSQSSTAMASLARPAGS